MKPSEPLKPRPAPRPTRCLLVDPITETLAEPLSTDPRGPELWGPEEPCPIVFAMLSWAALPRGQKTPEDLAKRLLAVQGGDTFLRDLWAAAATGRQRAQGAEDSLWDIEAQRAGETIDEVGERVQAWLEAIRPGASSHSWR